MTLMTCFINTVESTKTFNIIAALCWVRQKEVPEVHDVATLLQVNASVNTIGSKIQHQEIPNLRLTPVLF